MCHFNSPCFFILVFFKKRFTIYFVYDFTYFFTGSLCRIAQWECDLAHTLESFSCGKEQRSFPAFLLILLFVSGCLLIPSYQEPTVSHIESKEAEQY